MLPPDTTIEFDDQGPDHLGRRHFTLTWPVEPRLVGFPETPILSSHRAQCFFSTQWREFIAQGAKVIAPRAGAGS